MSFYATQSRRGACMLLGMASLCVALTSPASADLLHKYTFNDGTANDSVGTAHGTIVDNTGISTFTGGALDLRANNTGSNQDFTQPTTVGAYVDLPNGVFTDAVTDFSGTGAFGAVTIEAWFTVETHRDWARLFDFGTSDAGENSSAGAGASEYVFFAPRRGGTGAGPAQTAGSTHNASGDVFNDAGFTVTTNVQHHVVYTLDQNDFTAGFDGTATLYIDNGTPIVAGIAGGLFLDSIPDVNNWLGRAQWPDALYDGLINEVSIYNGALTAGQVATNFSAGPVPVPLPVLRVNRDTGAVSLVNPSGSSFNVTGYSITSAAGALDTAGWTSIDAGAFDPDGTWTASPAPSATEISESVTGGATDGGAIAGGGSASIGSAWLQTPLSSDLQFTFDLAGGTSGAGLIEYVGGEPIRSDLNGDGNVNAADWALFVPNNGSAFGADLPVAAYLKGDLDGDLDNDYDDFTLFKADFIAANGAPAFAALVGVPEPASLALAALAALGLATVRRRR
ncbi:MAG: LamG domain-containing protein [Planctomycetales bacterium]|nr:LamG domain-containing protein [Planctomycetales bacterium]